MVLHAPKPTACSIALLALAPCDVAAGFLDDASQDIVEFVGTRLVAPLTTAMGFADEVVTAFVANSVVTPFTSLLTDSLQPVLVRNAQVLADSVDSVLTKVLPKASEMCGAMSTVLGSTLPSVEEVVCATWMCRALCRRRGSRHSCWLPARGQPGLVLRCEPPPPPPPPAGL